MSANNPSANHGPLITVVMATYNGALFVAEAIDSILAQTFSNFEFIIIDDGSQDNTLDILLSYSDSRVRVVKNDRNRGTSYSRNLGISQAKGRYIANMDQDDISHPERLGTQFTFMEDNPNIGMCGTWAQTFGAETRLIKRPFSNSEIKARLFWICPFVHPSTMLRVAVLRDFKLFYNDVIAEDYDLWCRMTSLCDMANIPRALLNYRVHAQQISASKYTSLVESTTHIRLRNVEALFGRPLFEKETSILRYNTSKSTIAVPDIFDFFLAIKRENDQKMLYDRAYFDKISFDFLKKILRKSARCSNILSFTMRRYLSLLPSYFGVAKTIRLYLLLLLPKK